MRTLKLISGLVLFLQIFLSHAAVFTPETETDIRAYINTSMNCRRIPGMTLAVVKDNEVWTSGFGTADFSSDKQVDSNSIFNIGSVSKSFTTTLLGMLLSEHGYDWSTKVTDILGPGYEFVDNYRTQELTLKDLLSHRTGLAGLDIGLMSGIPRSVSRSTFTKHLKYLPEKRPIRDGWIYNNYIYMMLGHLTEILGKDTWENLVAERILQPLGMSRTRILRNPDDVLEPDVARPYIYKNDTFQNGTLEIYEIHPLEPAGAILSTATDMVKWIKFNLDLGRTESGIQLLDRKLMEEMHWVVSTFDNQNTMKTRFLTKPKYPVDEIQIGYVYAWFLSSYRGYKNVWHSGGLYSYITLMWTFPDVGVGIYASVNGPGYKGLSIRHLTATFYYISDYLLGLDPWLNETTACTFPEPWANNTVKESKEKEQPIVVDKLTEFQGSYANPLLPTIQVSAESSDLRLRSNRVRGTLHPSSEKDRFLWEVTYPWELAETDYTDANNETIYTNVTFLRNAKTGIVDGLKMEFEVNMTYAKDTSMLSKSSTIKNTILSSVSLWCFMTLMLYCILR